MNIDEENYDNKENNYDINLIKNEFNFININQDLFNNPYNEKELNDFNKSEITLRTYIKNYDKKLEPNIKIPKFTDLFLNEISLEDLMNFKYKNLTKKPFNIILDIDQTLIYSKQTLPEFLNKQDVFRLTGIDKNNRSAKFDLIMKFRPGLENFLKFCNKYANVYFCTMGIECYANEIMKIFEEKINIKFKKENLRTMEDIRKFHFKLNNDDNFQSIFKKNLKLYDENDINLNNTIIFDDFLNYWEDDNQNNVICSKKFFSFEDCENLDYFYFPYNQDEKTNNNSFNNQLNFDNNSNIFNNIKAKNIYFNYNNESFPIYYENENFSDLAQLNYIQNFIEKIFKFNLLIGKENLSIQSCIRIIKKKILKNCCINLKYFNNNEYLELIKKMIDCLGGKLTKEINETTHLIIENFDKKNIKNIKNNIFKVNIQWIFNCFFFLYRMDENNKLYKI